MDTSRYERIALSHSEKPGDIAAQFAAVGRTARLTIETRSEHQTVIRDVAAGVAAPALIGCVLWMLREAQTRKLRRLRFLSRDGQVLFELARNLAPKLHMDIDSEYVYSSRIT